MTISFSNVSEHGSILHRLRRKTTEKTICRINDLQKTVVNQALRAKLGRHLGRQAGETALRP